MGMMSNGRGKYGSTLVPSVIAKQQREPTRDNDERPQVDNLSEILSRASHTLDGAQRLKEMLASMTREPRAAITEIEQEIGLLRDLIAEREQVLVEAIDQHANLSKEAVHGMGVVRKALAQIRDAFNAAIRPMPIVDHRAATNTGSDDRPA
jgi:Glu-tRNA(Gln) amidotransferase subunit E-like FAD-binding protein